MAAEASAKRWPIWPSAAAIASAFLPAALSARVWVSRPSVNSAQVRLNWPTASFSSGVSLDFSNLAIPSATAASSALICARYCCIWLASVAITCWSTVARTRSMAPRTWASSVMGRSWFACTSRKVPWMLPIWRRPWNPSPAMTAVTTEKARRSFTMVFKFLNHPIADLLSRASIRSAVPRPGHGGITPCRPCYRRHVLRAC